MIPVIFLVHEKTGEGSLGVEKAKSDMCLYSTKFLLKVLGGENTRLMKCSYAVSGENINVEIPRVLGFFNPSIPGM